MKIKTNADIEAGSIGTYLYISDKRQSELSYKLFDLLSKDEEAGYFHKALEKAAALAETNEELFFIAFNFGTFMSKFGSPKKETDSLKGLLELLEMLSDKGAKQSTKQKSKTIN